MTADELKAIRERDRSYYDSGNQTHRDRRALLTHVDHLTALLREAREELNSWMYYGHGSRTSGFGSAPLCNRIEEATHE